jgi:hypothetical protein
VVVEHPTACGIPADPKAPRRAVDGALVERDEDGAERAVDVTGPCHQAQRTVVGKAQAQLGVDRGALDRDRGLARHLTRLGQYGANALAQRDGSLHTCVIDGTVERKVAALQPGREPIGFGEQIDPAAQAADRVQELLDQPQPARGGRTISAAVAREVVQKLVFVHAAVVARDRYQRTAVDGNVPRASSDHRARSNSGRADSHHAHRTSRMLDDRKAAQMMTSRIRQLSASRRRSAVRPHAIGPRAIGPTVMAPVAIGVCAIGLLAIRRVLIADAAIRRRRAGHVEIRSLKVGELEVAGRPWPEPSAPQPAQ